MSTAGFWDGLYAAAQDGWDLGAAAPASKLAGFGFWPFQFFKLY